VTVAFVGAHPNNDLHRGGTYFRVERQDGGEWRTVQDDGDWATRFTWERPARGRSEVTISWDIAPSTPVGPYRITYHGDAREEGGAVQAFSAHSPAFEVVATAPTGAR
jgi:neutral ceramidase